MRMWPRYPSLFEINTWVWLSDLSQKCQRRIDLGSVPPAEWDTIGGRGFDAVWLMGVWERSPRSIAISNANQGLLEEFRRALPDFRLADNVGSPYCCPAVRGGRAPGRSRGSCCCSPGAGETGHAPDCRSCAEPCGARPSMGLGTPGLFRPRAPPRML